VGEGLVVWVAVGPDDFGSAQINPNQSLQLEVGGPTPGDEERDSEFVVVVIMVDVTVAVRS